MGGLLRDRFQLVFYPQSFEPEEAVPLEKDDDIDFAFILHQFSQSRDNIVNVPSKFANHLSKTMELMAKNAKPLSYLNGDSDPELYFAMPYGGYCGLKIMMQYPGV